MASRAGFNEIIEGKLYQRGQFLSWPYSKKRKMLDERDISVVVNLWNKVDPDLSSEELGSVYLCWHCSPSSVPPGTDDFVDFVVSLMKDRTVLVHCEAGRGRSVWFSARVMARYLGIPGRIAHERILLAVPNADLTETLKQNLLNWLN